jgi:hypothetical protein
MVAFNVAAPAALTLTLFSMGGIEVTSIERIQGLALLEMTGSAVMTGGRGVQWSKLKEGENMIIFLRGRRVTDLNFTVVWKLPDKIAKTLHNICMAKEFGGIDVIDY